ncbi:Uncharacterised protein [Pseudomonas luteola]|uniref:Uncharacterized protein n=1 Tax=Pseudomonas luteola TaxID=47886 RepID=A0A2X2EF34_PSELU|nr:hypothetical protein [Pseudomonas luteola]SPZ05320.1 Uncharacterised protein [Pseudomonas luteola]
MSQLSLLPHYHHPISYSVFECEEDSFQSMLAVWYQVADLLRTQPPGTTINYSTGELVMGSIDGELYMFDSQDLSPTMDAHDCTLFRPDEFETDITDMDNIRCALEEWLKSPQYSLSVDPETLAEAIRNTYEAESQANWRWNGKV